MSIFVHVPDGFYQDSRFTEQIQAVSQPDQYSLRALFIIVAAIAVTLGGVRILMAAANNEQPVQVQPEKK